MTSLDRKTVRRLALHRSGLLGARSSRVGARSAVAAARAVDQMGYLQLDTIKVSGARSHGLVLASRLPGFATASAESLLGASRRDDRAPTLFEYWGHEVSWLPLRLYPALAYRRRGFRERPWYRAIVDEHPQWVDEVLARIEAEGPLRSRDFPGAPSSSGWYGRAPRQVLQALWSSGELSIQDRDGFERIYDLTERVIPADVGPDMPEVEGIALLLENAAALHGWAEARTLTETWRLRRTRHAVGEAFALLADEGRLLRCALQVDRRTRVDGWIRPADLELLPGLAGCRGPRAVLLSPFDPLVWDRRRAKQLFGFDAIMEFFKPAAERRYGYYCLPVLAGDRLVARVDLKTDRKRGCLTLVARHDHDRRADAAVPRALERHCAAVGLPLAP